MKKFFVVLLSVFMIFVMSSCGKINLSETEGDIHEFEEGVQQQLERNRSKLYRYYKRVFDEQYIINFKWVDTGSGKADFSKNTVAYFEDALYSNIKTDTSDVTTIIKNGKEYKLDNKKRSYTVKDYSGMAGIEISEVLKPVSYFDDKEYVKGTIVINEVRYDYEEFENDTHETKYCFDGNELKYILQKDEGTDELILVDGVSDEVDILLFEIPSGYVKR